MNCSLSFISSAGVLATALFALSSSASAQLPVCSSDGLTYQPVPLTGLESVTFLASSLNDAGEVSGAIPPAEGSPWRLAVWDDGAVALREFPGFVVTAEDLNEDGVVLATRRPLAGGSTEVLLWDSRADVLTVVPTPIDVFPAGVNEALEIVGVDDAGTFGFALDPSDGDFDVIAFSATPTPGVGTSGAHAISASGVAVGAEVIELQPGGAFEERPYRWSEASGIEELELVPNGFGGRAVDVADNGNIAGWVLDEFFARSSALWTNGGDTLVNLGSPPNFFVSDALALNLHDQVVVVAPNDFFGFTRGFVWEDGEWTDLSCFAPDGLFVTRPLDINNVGEILVQLTDAVGLVIVDTILLVPDTPFVPAAEVVRLGSPPNPAALLPGQTSGPVLGQTWDPLVDHTSFVPDSVLDVLGISLTAANTPSPPVGTILCGPTLFLQLRAPGNSFGVSIPDDPTLSGVSLCASGGSFDPALALFLTNALDITLGDF